MGFAGLLFKLFLLSVVRVCVLKLLTETHETGKNLHTLKTTVKIPATPAKDEECL